MCIKSPVCVMVTLLSRCGVRLIDHWSRVEWGVVTVCTGRLGLVTYISHTQTSSMVAGLNNSTMHLQGAFDTNHSYVCMSFEIIDLLVQRLCLS